MTFICYPKCTTCQKAQKWLDENGISYTFRDIKMENPTYEELSVWHQRSGLPLKKLFNTSGLLYKSIVIYVCVARRRVHEIQAAERPI